MFKRKEEVIDFMASKLVQKGYIDEDMKNLTLREKNSNNRNREYGNYTTWSYWKNFDNKIAIGILKSLFLGKYQMFV